MPTVSNREDSTPSKRQAQEERQLRLDICLVSHAVATCQGIP
jgi:hypothetical protein